ncbi:serine hydrolase domain-containing protein [Streptomyces sp. BI20]|uniref:serine hydrolase domain-containing protein n=1 Tax=Streptomyces sp. BI20 TaxID=3403460 RepID=UPI003C77E256
MTFDPTLRARFTAFVADAARRHGIPGASAGIRHGGHELFASHGVTSLDPADAPRPVDEHTPFAVGSITKTLTATALLRLAEQGAVHLNDPVTRHVPELRLADPAAADRITLRMLLNHTAGLDWNLVTDTGEGDDALAAFVAGLDELTLIGEPGARPSYSQAGFNLLGRVIEKVTGRTYERAVQDLLLTPLGLDSTTFAPDPGRTSPGRPDPARDPAADRPPAVGHNTSPDGALEGVGDWRIGRADHPGGGALASAADQLRWAAFHLGDGRAPNGERLLTPETLRAMRTPTATLRASTLGDALGLCWFLREIDGVPTIGHGGSTNGQFAELLLAPERGFAVTSAANAGPAGIVFNQEVVRWALENVLGAVDRDPEPLPHDPARAAEFAGVYEIDAMWLTITADEHGMALGAALKAEVRAASDTPMPPDHEPAAMGLLPGDEYVVTAGGLSGQRGFFTRDSSGRITGVDLAGRLFTRTDR